MLVTAEIVKAMQQGDGTTAPPPGGSGGKQWHGLYF